MNDYRMHSETVRFMVKYTTGKEGVKLEQDDNNDDIENLQAPTQ
jgi:hypothetical protein